MIENKKPVWTLVLFSIIALAGLISGSFLFLNPSNILIQNSSLNNFLFYRLNTPFFLDFNFHQIHPYYIIISLLLRLLPLKVLFAAFMIFLGWINFKRYKKNGVHLADIVMILLLLILGDNDYGLYMLLWLQVSLYFFYREKITFRAAVIFLLSLIYLPGIFFLLLIELVQELSRFSDKNNLVKFVREYSIALGLIFFFHMFIALLLFEIKPDKLLSYFSLPFWAQLTKLQVKGLSYSDIFFIESEGKSFLYFSFLMAVLFAFVSTNRKKFLLELGFFLFSFLLFYLLFPYSLTTVLTGFIFIFLWNISENISDLKKYAFLIFILILVFFEKLVSIDPDKPQTPEIRAESVCLSAEDFFNVRINSKNLKKVYFLDLKIIPSNVTRLMEDTKSGKIEPILDDKTRVFLEKEMKYSEEEMPLIQHSVLVLKSKIHPDFEAPPYRRIYFIWKEAKNSGGEIFLF